MGGHDGKKPSDDARRKILARRASFVAAALAGISCHDPGGKPEPCLSVVQDPHLDADARALESPSSPPTSPPAYEPAVPAASTSAKPEPAAKPDAGRPHPCLKMRPQPCLKIAKPDDR